MVKGILIAAALLISADVSAKVKRSVGIYGVSYEEYMTGFVVKFKARVREPRSLTCELMYKGKDKVIKSAYAVKGRELTIHGRGKAPNKIKCYYWLN